jgi:S1-C subfamily serine protease
MLSGLTSLPPRGETLRRPVDIRRYGFLFAILLVQSLPLEGCCLDCAELSRAGAVSFRGPTTSGGDPLRSRPSTTGRSSAQQQGTGSSSPGSALEQTAPPTGAEAVATAFYINKRGQLLTTWEEVRGCRKVAIMSNYELHDASIASGNPLNGLALLQTGASPTAYATFRTSSVVEGEGVRTISYPVLDGLSMPLGVAQGTVRTASNSESARGVFAVSAFLDGQTAGGPIVDKRGDVIGITVDTPTAGAPSSVGYGISNALILKFLSAAGVEIPTREKDGLGNARSEQDIASYIGSYTVPVICFR